MAEEKISLTEDELKLAKNLCKNQGIKIEN